MEINNRNLPLFHSFLSNNDNSNNEGDCCFQNNNIFGIENSTQQQVQTSETSEQQQSPSVLSVVAPATSLLSCSERVTTAFQRRQPKQQKEQEQQVNIDTESLLAKEMNKLTIIEREDAYEDVHGVRQAIEETDELIQSKLYEMDIEISKVINHHNNNPNNNYANAYILAKQISNEYVTNRKLRLMFLRSCRFNIKQTIKKIILFFEEKLLYFGRDKLCKTITLSDLSHEDINCLKSGRFQLLPYRDRTGRPIVSIYLNKTYNYKSNESMLRAVFYFFMAIVENEEENQKRGFVILHFNNTDATNTNYGDDHSEHELHKRSTKFSNAIPISIRCCHFCFESSIFVDLISAIVSIIEPSIPARIRFHQGSKHIEYCYSLLTYGIPIDFIPLTNDNKSKIDNHLKWLQRRQYMENVLYNTQNVVTATLFLFNGINLPNRYDVLIGKGKPIQDHTGNIYLRDIIDEHYLKEYNHAAHGTKNKIIYKAIEHIKITKGGRFLQQQRKTNIDGGWWYEVSDDIAYKKVGNRFRRNSTNKKSSKPMATIKLSNDKGIGNNNHTKKFKLS